MLLFTTYEGWELTAHQVLEQLFLKESMKAGGNNVIKNEHRWSCTMELVIYHNDDIILVMPGHNGDMK